MSEPKNGKRVTIRLSEKEVSMLDDLRAILLAGSDSAVIRRVIGDVHSAFRQAGAIRSLASLRKADGRQLSLLKEEVKKTRRSSRQTTRKP